MSIRCGFARLRVPFWGIALAAMLSACSGVFPSAAPETPWQVARPDERPVRPFRGLIYTEPGIREVRQVARKTERGRALAEEIFESAAPWMDMSDDELRALVPAPDAVFGFATAGDPKTNQSWPRYGRSGGVCSLDRPGTVKSPHTGDVYGAAKPGEPYYDGGDGWVRPSDGKRFYFKGIWNSWIVHQLHEAVDDLALTYMLTGDEKVAARGLLILDELAAMKAKRGECPGFPDGSAYGAENKHFLAYSGNGANHRMLQTVFSFDLLAGFALAQTPSLASPGKTVFENVRDNYFGVYELLYKKSRHTLYNHTTILFANQMGQAVLFGRPDELAEGLEVLTVWLDQCLTRDGQYYENAGGYERVGVNYAATMMLPLANYSPANYDNPSAFPNPKDYPFDLRFGNDPRWYSAAYLMKYRMMAAGRMICYGDMWADRLVQPGKTREWDPRLWCSFGRLLYQQTDRPDWKEEISRRYWRLPDDVRNEPVLSNIRAMGMSQWFEPDKPKSAQAPEGDLLRKHSDFLPGKMIALMRGGRGVDHRTAFMCGSVHYSHGHDDQMGLILYAKGMCLTGIYGYPRAGSPAHRGWSIKPASKWTLIVNEDLPAPKYPGKDTPAASLQAWIPDGAGASAQIVEMSNPHLWHHRIAPGMSEYRRLHWVVDVSDEEFYFLDFFRATGGRTHDYMWSGQWLDQARPSEGFAVEGVRPEPVDGVWSLAGLNSRYRRADYNVPGRSWGERLESGSGGRIESLGIPGEPINVGKRWNPPPGNGYGFIYDVRRDETDGNWSATWDLIDKKNTMRLTFVNNENQQAIAARNPAMEVDRYHSMVIARRAGKAPLRSRFAALIEAAPRGKWPVREAVRLDIDPDAGMGVRLALDNGCVDYALAGADAGSVIEADGVVLHGARGFVRMGSGGEAIEMVLHEGTKLDAGTCGLRFDAPSWEARVTAIEAGETENRVTVDAALPEGARMAGRPAIFSDDPEEQAPSYLHDEAYVIESVKSDDASSVLSFGAQRIVASRVTVESVEEDGTINTTWPNEIRGGRYADTGTFTGREVAVSGDPDRATQVVSYPKRKQFTPERKGLFRAGDRLEFRMVKEGDKVRVARLATLRRTGEGRWLLKANADVTVRLPAKTGESVYAMRDGRPEKLAMAREGVVECVVPIASAPDGATELIVGR